jgi:hypothetical protein
MRWLGRLFGSFDERDSMHYILLEVIWALAGH